MANTNRPNTAPRFDVYDRDGMTRMFKAMYRNSTNNGYDWRDNYGFITDHQIKREGWIIVPAAMEVGE